MTKLTISRRGFLAASAGALASSSLPTVSRAQSAPIRIGVGSDPVYASFFIASHEKLFEAEKVNVSLQTYTDGGTAMNALVAQQVDVSAASEPTTLIRMTRADLKALSVVYQSGKYIKLVLGKTVSGPKDIKRFGIVPGSVSEYCAGLTMQKLGIDPGSVALVPSGPPELPALLIRGDIDAFFAWEPWPAIAVSQGGKVALTSVDIGYRDTMWFTASTAIVKSNPDDLQAILRALAKACDIARNDPKSAAAAVKALTHIPEETSLKAFADMTPVVRDFTPDDYKSYDGIVDFLAEHKVTKEPVAYRDMLAAGFYKG